VTTINDFVEVWCEVIDQPIIINKKQGFLLNNGIRMLFNDSHLSIKSKERLSRHYNKVLNKTIKK